MSVKRNIVANYAGQGIATLLSLALVPVYITYLGIEAYALVGLFAVIQSWLALLDLGMTPTLGREMARFSAGRVGAQAIRDLLRSLETITFGLAAIAGLALTLGSGLVARYWLNAQSLPVATVAGALSMLGIVVALRFCEGLYRSGLMGLQQQVWVNVAGTLLALLRSLGALGVLALVSPTIEAFFAWQGLVSLLSLGVLAWRLHASLPAPPRPARFSLAALRDIRRFAGGVFGISLLAVLLQNVDKLLLSRLLGLADFGYYMLGATLAAGLLLISGPIVLAVAPMLVRLHDSGNDAGLAITYHKSAQLVTVALAPAALVLAAFAPGVLFAWSGDAAIAARTAPVLALLALGNLANALMQIPHQLQLAAGWTGLATRVNIAAVVVMIPLLAWAVPQFGAPAAALVWLGINLGYLLYTIPAMHRRLLPGEMWHWYWSDVLRPLAGAAMAIAAAALLAPGADASRLDWLGFMLASGSAATLAAALLAGTVRQRIFAVPAVDRVVTWAGTLPLIGHAARVLAGRAR